MVHLGNRHGFLLAIGFLSPVATGLEPGRAIAGRALAYDHVREVGSNWGPEVSYFLAQVGIKRPAPWCGAYAFTIRKEAGYIPKGKASAYAWVPSWVNAGKVIWKRSSGERPTRHLIKQGDVILLWYPKLKRLGHIGTVIEVRKDGVVCSEGNTNTGGSREGDGVRLHYRPFNTIHTIVRPSWILE